MESKNKVKKNLVTESAILCLNASATGVLNMKWYLLKTIFNRQNLQKEYLENTNRTLNLITNCDIL